MKRVSCDSCGRNIEELPMVKRDIHGMGIDCFYYSCRFCGGGKSIETKPLSDDLKEVIENFRKHLNSFNQSIDHILDDWLVNNGGHQLETLSNKENLERFKYEIELQQGISWRFYFMDRGRYLDILENYKKRRRKKDDTTMPSLCK